MFWAYNASPQIDSILCKEDLTLYELLDQENVLQELKAQNLKLIEFLLKPEILYELVTLITSEPPSSIDEAEQYKYPNLACELLTSDLPALNERLVSEEILNKLYNFLENEPPLNPLLSSYFSRTLSVLISRKSEQNWYSYQYTCLQALEFLKAKGAFIELLLKHIGTSSIMNLLHNMVTLIEGPELKQWLRSWLQSQNVIPSLIGLLNPHSDVDCQVNAASVICSIVQKLRENMDDMNEDPKSDPILNLLESSQTVDLLLNTVFNNDTVCETTIEGGIDVLLAIIQPYLPEEAQCRQELNYTVHDKIVNAFPQNTVETENVLPDIITAVLPHIAKLRDILKNPVKKEPIKLTSGIISPPFGKARILVAKLIAVLISLNNGEINEEIIHCDIPELLLNLFYAYSSNNFLHAEVEKLIACAIDSLNNCSTSCYDDLLLAYLFRKCKLIQRILDMWNNNDEFEKQGNYRKGYMGYIIRIAMLVFYENERNPIFHNILEAEVPNADLEEWNTFVEVTLKPIIEKHTTCLGGVRPKMGQGSETSFEENISGKELKSSTFKDYLADDDQNVIFSIDPSTMDFVEEGYYLDRSPDSQSQSMFNAICAQRWQSFNKGLDNIDDNEDDSSNIGFDTKSPPRNEKLWLGIDSDDEDFDEDSVINMSDPWAQIGNTSDPWSNNSSNNNSGCGSSNDNNNNNNNIKSNINASEEEDTNWANFEENFCISESKVNGSIEPCSTLATDVEQYSLFGSVGNEDGVSILRNLSNVKIAGNAEEEPELDEEDEADTNVHQTIVSTVRFDEYHSPEMLNGGIWKTVTNIQIDPSTDSVNESVHSSYSGNAPTPDNFGGSYEIKEGSDGANHAKVTNDIVYDDDRSDEIVNLESISGNTLAEKIANAENDILNEKENLLKGLKEQGIRDSFDLPSTIEEMEKRVPSIGDTEVCEDDIGADEFNNAEETSQEQAYLSVKNRQNDTSDCLTENSVDFVTAENSTSDAESSVEFGDAENSLELEDETSCDKLEHDDSQMVLCDSLNATANEIICDSKVDENVPTCDKMGETCNIVKEELKEAKVEIRDGFTDENMVAFPVGEKTIQAEGEPCGAILNGDVTDEIIDNCDNSKDSCDSCSVSREQTESVYGNIIKELA